MEIWDAYHADGTPANRELIRGEPIPEGLYHLTCDILVRHADGDYLLMQRDTAKPNYGGWFEASAGGSALRGESSLTCATRELREETGICAEKLLALYEEVKDSRHGVYRGYLCITDCQKDSIVLQEGETVAYQWATAQEIADMMKVQPPVCVIQRGVQVYLGILKMEGQKDLQVFLRKGAGV